MSAKLVFFATCPKGVNDLLTVELNSFGAEKVKESAAGVRFTGSLEVAYRFCLWSRVGSRLLLPLADFPVSSEEDLYEGVRDVPWEDHFSCDSTIAVNASGKAGTVDHTHFASLKVKDAVVDRFRDLLGRRPSVNVRCPDIRLNIHMARNRGTVSLDLSGESLHRRGYRHERGKAPLKENLAAAILMRSGWPQLSADGSPFIDPMCGSGTFPIESALMAGDVAPGTFRSSFGFLSWKNHRAGIWTKLQVEARYRMKEGLERMPVILGFDSDRAAVRTALANLRTACLERRVHIERRDLHSLVIPQAVRDRSGLIVVNPPYGERLGEEASLRTLYSALGERLREEFKEWHVAVFTGNPELGRELGLRAVKINNLYNGNIKCRLLQFDIRKEFFTGTTPEKLPEQIFEDEAGEKVRMFANRLRKNLRVLRGWADSKGVTCFRLYDADLPEFNLAVDIYDGWVHVQEYQAPVKVDPRRSDARLKAALVQIRDILDLPEDRIILKVRKRQRGGAQYGKKGEKKEFLTVSEGGLRFLVNLTDYLDTGLFLDHRLTRGMLRELAFGKTFLNLFCYTGTATVYATAGGAVSTTSVDLSNTYLDWARRNMELNDLLGPGHQFQRADVLRWIRKHSGRYGLIYLDPPTYSRSKAMEGDFDIQRDHVVLIRDAARLLEKGGILIFSTNRRKFELNRDSLAELSIEDITQKTIPKDFEKSRWVHRCYKIRTQDTERRTQDNK